MFVWFLLSQNADNQRQTMRLPRLIFLYNSIKNLDQCIPHMFMSESSLFTKYLFNIPLNLLPSILSLPNGKKSWKIDFDIFSGYKQSPGLKYLDLSHGLRAAKYLSFRNNSLDPSRGLNAWQYYNTMTDKGMSEVLFFVLPGQESMRWLLTIMF